MDKIIVNYDLSNLAITIETDKYTRVINCKTLESYLEEIRRLYNDLKEYIESEEE